MSSNAALPVVVVVEDDVMTCRLIAQMLRRSVPCTAYECHTVTAALAQCAAVAVQLLVVDYSLPDGDGVQLAEEVRVQWPGTPLVMLTGTTDPDLPGRAVTAGVLAYLIKPVNVPELLRVVLALLP